MCFVFGAARFDSVGLNGTSVVGEALTAAEGLRSNRLEVRHCTAAQRRSGLDQTWRNETLRSAHAIVSSPLARLSGGKAGLVMSDQEVEAFLAPRRRAAGH
jgi:hypothetical protein